MKYNKANLFQGIHYNHLEAIGGIKFTPREIDVIACLLGGRSSKTISQFLSIEEKTVETHKYNVMRKLECNSKENVINFIEKSDKLAAIKKHYLGLLSQSLFEKVLQEVSRLNAKKNASCTLIYWQEQENKTFLSVSLKKHLQSAGFKVSLEGRENYKSLNHLIHKLGSEAVDCIIYMLPNNLLYQLQAGDNKGNLEIFPFIQKVPQKPGSVIFLLDADVTTAIPSEIQTIGYVNLEAQGNYYFSVLEILRRMISDKGLDKAFLDFKTQYETLHGSFEQLSSPLWPEIPPYTIEKKYGEAFLCSFLQIKKAGLILGITLLLSACGLFLTFNTLVTQSNGFSKARIIRSDLPLPIDNTLLNRAKMLEQVESKFKGQEGIQTIALIGPGGAGKTTIARQYARQQNSSVVWEVNAETQDSFMRSLESLAYSLCQTEEEKKILKDLQEIKKLPEREDKIILFVKERLRPHPNWFLLLDNVESFEKIQKYFPVDSATWGAGKIVITTRDANIQNNSHINQAILMEELNNEEKLGLFRSIIRNEHSSYASQIQRNAMENFLKAIPPFPLDVSVAAYYMKITNISYEQYLEKLRENNKDFEDTQETILKEASLYKKTRYNIISLSVKEIIKIDKSFESLLFFISILDSQDIPRPLLDSYKDNITIDRFIYNLKKYSLVTSSALSPNLISSISLHRSTQSTILDYFLKKLDFKNRDLIIQSIIHTLENYIENTTNSEDYLTMKLLINHCEKLISRENLLDNTVRESIRSSLGFIFYFLGDYEKSQQYIEESLSMFFRQKNRNNAKICQASTYLGIVYRETGKYEKAKDLFNLSLKTYKQYFFKSYDKIAQALINLGSVDRELGNYEKAKDFLEQSLTIYKKYLPQDHLGMARTLTYLGIADKELGNYENAINFFEKSLAIYRKYLSKNQVGAAWTSAHLGNIYGELGEYEKAKDLIEPTLTIYKKYFPENHIGVAWALAQLGNIYRKLKKYEKAKDLLEQSILIYKGHFSENHIRYSSSILYFGYLYIDLMNHKEAKTYLEKTLKTYQEHYGKNHFETARILQALGNVYFLEGNYEIAEELLNDSLKIFQKIDHPDSSMSLEILTNLYLKKSMDALKAGDTQQFQIFKAQAINNLGQALKIVKSRFPAHSPHLLRIKSKLKKLYSAA